LGEYYFFPVRGSPPQRIPASSVVTPCDSNHERRHRNIIWFHRDVLVISFSGNIIIILHTRTLKGWGRHHSAIPKQKRDFIGLPRGFLYNSIWHNLIVCSAVSMAPPMILRDENTMQRRCRFTPKIYIIWIRGDEGIK